MALSIVDPSVDRSLRSVVVSLIAVFALAGGCRTAAPPIRFAPPGTDTDRLRREFALTEAERRALAPDTMRSLTQGQIDQIYTRLSAGPIPDGPFRGDLFFPRDRDGRARIRDLSDPAPNVLGPVAALPAEQFGRMFWRGKVFFRSQAIVRNRIEDLVILRPIISEAETVPKLTFDGQTTWLLFPARLSCGDSRFDPTRRSIVVDYSVTEQIEGYRDLPDRVAGPKGLNIRDEVRVIRPGFYLGRAYFGPRFGLNFTLLDPASGSGTASMANVQDDCGGSR
ncbi:MAG: hypothetical protein ACRD2N_00915 [Vicinamibacterales bacterium]